MRACFRYSASDGNLMPGGKHRAFKTIVVVLIVTGGGLGLVHAKQVCQVTGETLKVGPFSATAALPAFNELINVYAQISVPFGFWVSTL